MFEAIRTTNRDSSRKRAILFRQYLADKTSADILSDPDTSGLIERQVVNSLSANPDRMVLEMPMLVMNMTEQYRLQAKKRCREVSEMLDEAERTPPSLSFCFVIRWRKTARGLADPRAVMWTRNGKYGVNIEQEEGYFTAGNRAANLIPQDLSIYRIILDGFCDGVDISRAVYFDPVFKMLPRFKDNVSFSEIAGMFQSLGYKYWYKTTNETKKHHIETHYFERGDDYVREKAKSCPFCGCGTIRLAVRTFEGTKKVMFFRGFCDECGASTREIKGFVQEKDYCIDEVIRLWNRRAKEGMK